MMIQSMFLQMIQYYLDKSETWIKANTGGVDN